MPDGMPRDDVYARLERIEELLRQLLEQVKRIAGKPERY